MQNEQLFQDGILVQMLTQSQNTYTVSINNDKNTEQIIDVKIISGQGIDSSSFIKIDMENRIVLKKFMMFELTNNPALKPDPSSNVVAQTNEPISLKLFKNWVENSFCVGSQNLQSLIRQSGTKFELKAVNVRDGGVVTITVDGNAIKIGCQSMEVASDIIQDLLGRHLMVQDLSSKASFPTEMAVLQEVLERIAESNQLKTHFAANISDSIQNLKVAVVKAEASLIISDISSMRKNYALV